MSCVVRFGVTKISETACLRILTRARQRAVIASDLDVSVGKTEARCSVDSFSVMVLASR